MPNKNSGRAQASIDMLIAYGIAILIIAVAIYTLLNLGALNSRLVPGYCNSASSFGCSGYSLSTNGLLTLVITQSTGSTINITGVACAASANSLGTLGPAYGNANVKSYSSAPYFYANNQLKNGLLVYAGNQTKFVVQCYRNSGIAKGTLGAAYSGQVWINYTIPSLPGHNIQQIISVSTEYTATGPSITTTTSTSSTSVTSSTSTSTSSSTSMSTTSTSTSSTLTSTSSTSTSVSSTSTSSTVLYTYGGMGDGPSAFGVSTTLASGFNYYFCGAYSGAGINTISWTVDEGTASSGGPGTSEGHQSSNVCNLSGNGSGDYSIVGIGIDAPSYSFIGSNIATTNPYTFNYTVNSSNQFTIILYNSEYAGSNPDVTLPSGCINLAAYASGSSIPTDLSYLAVCSGETPGTYNVVSAQNNGYFEGYPDAESYVVYAVSGATTTSTSTISTSSTSSTSTSTSSTTTTIPPIMQSVGGTSSTTYTTDNYALAEPITATSSGTLVSVGFNIAGWYSGTGDCEAAIYSSNGQPIGSGAAPTNLLGYSASTGIGASSGFYDLSITSNSVNIASGTVYWLAYNCNTNYPIVYYDGGNTGSLIYVPQTYGTFANPYTSGYTTDTGALLNMRMTYNP